MPADETRAPCNQDSHTKIKQSDASIQRAMRCKVEIPKGRSIPQLVPKTKKFWRSEQSIVASRRYERECWATVASSVFLANDESRRSFSCHITLKSPRQVTGFARGQ